MPAKSPSTRKSRLRVIIGDLAWFLMEETYVGMSGPEAAARGKLDESINLASEAADLLGKADARTVARAKAKQQANAA